MIKEIKEGIIVQLKIAPNSSKNEILKDDTGVKVKLTAQPIEGKANKALIEFLSKQFKIPKSSVIITKGETSKDKTLLIKVSDSDKISAIKDVLEN